MYVRIFILFSPILKHLTLRLDVFLGQQIFVSLKNSIQAFSLNL